MDIILPTRFNNPNLPVVQRPGFVDTFDRPEASTLGFTENGRPWETFGEHPWSVTSDSTAYMGSGSRMGIAAADGLTADGIVTATLATLGDSPSNHRAGLALRVQDADNFIYVASPYTTPHNLGIGVYVGGSVTMYATDGPVLAAGDTLAAEMRGTEFKVYVNGTQVMTADVPDLATNTKHGLYGWAGSHAEWGSIEFSA